MTAQTLINNEILIMNRIWIVILEHLPALRLQPRQTRRIGNAVPPRRVLAMDAEVPTQLAYVQLARLHRHDPATNVRRA